MLVVEQLIDHRLQDLLWLRLRDNPSPRNEGHPVVLIGQELAHGVENQAHDHQLIPQNGRNDRHREGDSVDIELHLRRLPRRAGFSQTVRRLVLLRRDDDADGVGDDTARRHKVYSGYPLLSRRILGPLEQRIRLVARAGEFEGTLNHADGRVERLELSDDGVPLFAQLLASVVQGENAHEHLQGRNRRACTAMGVRKRTLLVVE